MKFSVIIPVYNEGERIIPCVQSVLNQTFQDFEIIIVDNNSNDNTYNVAKNINSNKIKVIQYNKIQSSAAARNAGIAAAQGEVFAFLDADCIAEEHWLENSLKYFKRGAELIAGHVDCGSNKNGVEAWNLVFELDQEASWKKGYAITANVLAKRELFEDYGLFNPYYITGEDVAWTSQFVKWIPDKFVYAWDVKVSHYVRNLKGLFNKGFFRQYYMPPETIKFIASQNKPSPLIKRILNRLHFITSFCLCWVVFDVGSMLARRKRKIKDAIEKKKSMKRPPIFSQQNWDTWSQEFSRFYETLDKKLIEAKAHYNGGMGKDDLRYIYSLVRETQPNKIIETGICNGLSSAIILYALHQNNKGFLVSVDLPEDDHGLGMTQLDAAAFSMIPKGKKVGWLVPEFLRENWAIFYGDSHQVLAEMAGEFDIFIHDSLHTKEHVLGELKLVKPLLSPKAFIIVDDVNWHDGFEEYCESKRLLYGYISDRMGIARLRE